MISVFSRDLQFITLILLAATICGVGWNLVLKDRSAWERLPVSSSKEASVSIADIVFTDLATAIQKGGVVILDARDAMEFIEGHLPGARNLPAKAGDKALIEEIKRIQADARPLVVVYCTSVVCEDADLLAARLVAWHLGKTVSIYRGGWEEWRANAKL